MGGSAWSIGGPRGQIHCRVAHRGGTRPQILCRATSTAGGLTGALTIMTMIQSTMTLGRSGGRARVRGTAVQPALAAACEPVGCVGAHARDDVCSGSAAPHGPHSSSTQSVSAHAGGPSPAVPHSVVNSSPTRVFRLSLCATERCAARPPISTQMRVPCFVGRRPTASEQRVVPP